MKQRHMGRILLAQKQFLALIGLTVCINVVIFICCLPSQVRPPEYVSQKIFMSMDCSDGRRMGNLMFNYASLVGLSQLYNSTPVMETDFRLFNVFSLSAAKSVNIRNTLGSYINYEEYGRRACAFDFNVRHIKRENTMFYGYFQSWKYFENAVDLVRKEFSFQDSVLNEAKITHNLVRGRTKDLTVIGIHVRRGDTLESGYSNYGYTSPDKGYYRLAMDYFREKFKRIAFIVCSDDKEWSKNNIASEKGENLTFSDSESDAIDLAILSMCDHMIVSVGSFGWWAAWLANGTTVYYSKWPRPVSKLEYMVTKRDYFYSHWIPLP